MNTVIIATAIFTMLLYCAVEINENSLSFNSTTCDTVCRQKAQILRNLYYKASEFYHQREKVREQQLIRQIRSELLRDEYQKAIMLNNTEENEKYVKILSDLL